MLVLDRTCIHPGIRLILNCYTDICDLHTWLKPSQIAERQTVFNDPAIVFLSTSAWNALIKVHKSIALIVDPVALSVCLVLQRQIVYRRNRIVSQICKT